MNSSTSGWLVLTRNFVAGSHPQNDTVLFLHVFYTWLNINLYIANFLAIVLVTFWNFWMNAVFNWRIGPDQQ